MRILYGILAFVFLVMFILWCIGPICKPAALVMMVIGFIMAVTQLVIAE